MAMLKTLTVNGVTYKVTPVVPATSVTLLAAGWVGSEGSFSQVVTVEGVTNQTKVDLQPTPEQVEIFLAKTLAFVAENNGGVVTVYSVGDVPTDDYTIQVTLTEVEGPAPIRGDTVGLPNPQVDWDQTDPTKADYIKNTPSVRHSSGSTISLADSGDSPLHGLTLYGKTTQDGTPTPEVPVELVSVGAGGSVGVTVSGKNLASAQMVYVGAPYYAEVEEDGKRCIKFHSNQDVKNVPFAFQENTRYTISLDAKTVLVATANGTPENILSVWYTDGTKQVQNMLPDKPWTHITITTYAGKTVTAIGVTSTNYISDIFVDIDTFQIEEGTTATAYEPYKGQTLTASTPGGLPGIPVTSGGNYTDSTGQMWICDEKDFARGKRVQRIGTKVFDGTEAIVRMGTKQFGYVLGDDTNTDLTINDAICDHFEYVANSYGKLVTGFVKHNQHTIFRYMELTEDSAAAFQAYLAEQNANGMPVTLQYILATPIETDLSAEELAQYAALHTNKPNTTIYNDAGAHMDVKYFGKNAAVPMNMGTRATGKVLSVNEKGYVVAEDVTDVGAAPAGYGLGDQCKSIDDWNNATLTGWYKSNVNTPTGSFMFGQAILYSPGTILQKAYAHNNGIYLEAHRECVSGTWGEWEWVNPPMVLGMEYRTTERRNGKAVWTAFISFGELAAGTHTIYTDIQAVSFVRSDVIPAVFPEEAQMQAWLYSVNCNVVNSKVWARIYIGTGMGTASVSVQVWYTKE